MALISFEFLGQTISISENEIIYVSVAVAIVALVTFIITAILVIWLVFGFPEEGAVPCVSNCQVEQDVSTIDELNRVE